MMTAGLTSPVKSHLCDFQRPRPARLGSEVKGSLHQEREPDTHHDVQQEKSLRILLRDTNIRCTEHPDVARPVHTCFSVALSCVLALFPLEPSTDTWVSVCSLVPQGVLVLLLELVEEVRPFGVMC